MNLKRNKQLNRKKGAAIEMALVTVLIVGALCMVLVTVSLTQSNVNKNHKNRLETALSLDAVGMDAVSEIDWASETINIGEASPGVSSENQYTLKYYFSTDNSSGTDIQKCQLWIFNSKGVRVLYAYVTKNVAADSSVSNVINTWALQNNKKVAVPDLPGGASTKYIY